MLVAVYSPYLSAQVIGGGEKHILEFARVVALKHTVHIALSKNPTEPFTHQIKRLSDALHSFLGWSTDMFTFVETPLGTSAGAIEKLLWTQRYDYLYSVTDGSLHFSLAKKNNLHIQIPFTNSHSSVIDRLKLLNWTVKNTNSEFTKNIVEKSWQTKIPFVHHPLVQLAEFAPSTKKSNVILSVGRFFTHLHSKRQDILIEAFKKLVLTYPKTFSSWKLVLVGPNDDEQFVRSLQKQARGLAVEFFHNIERKTLVKLYNSSRLYWHASGYQRDPISSPEAVEHFGISIVEAMASGAVPIVVGSGGPAEILSGDLRVLQWQSIDECVAITSSLIHESQDETKLRTACIHRAKDFSEKVFESKVWQMI